MFVLIFFPLLFFTTSINFFWLLKFHIYLKGPYFWWQNQEIKTVKSVTDKQDVWDYSKDAFGRYWKLKQFIFSSMNIRVGDHQRPENWHMKSYVLYHVTKRTGQRCSRGVQMLSHTSSRQLLCSLQCAGDVSPLAHKMATTVLSTHIRTAMSYHEEGDTVVNISSLYEETFPICCRENVPLARILSRCLH